MERRMPKEKYHTRQSLHPVQKVATDIIVSIVDILVQMYQPRVNKTLAGKRKNWFRICGKPTFLWQFPLHAGTSLLVSRSKSIRNKRTIHSNTWQSNQRPELFFPGKQVKMMENLPSVQDTIIQHTNQSIHQVRIWLISLTSQQNILVPDHICWRKPKDLW